MNKKEKKDNLVEKREIIDNATLAEMNEKYPKVSKNGVAFDLGLTYITIQTDYLGSTNIRKLIKNYGAEIVAVICFFRTEMCQPYGWYCKIDNDNLENLIEKCAFTLRMDEDRVKECYQALVDNMAFFVIGDENGSYLADTQQLYNFEILNNSRVRERERKAKNRAKAAAEKTNKEQDISSGSVTAPVKESAPSEPIGDLPNDEADPFGW